MALDLPEPIKTQLKTSPLDLVVCQVQYDHNLAVADAKVARAFHEALGGRDGQYPLVEQIEMQNVKLALGPGIAAPTSSGTAGWRFADREGGWFITLMPDHVALETTAYTTWEGEFRDRLEKTLGAAAEEIEPSLENRLGLRYIDRIEDESVETPKDWARCIEPALLGVPLHEGLGSGLLSAQQVAVLELAEDVRCGLRHGFAMEKAEVAAYLLDFDIYREESRAFGVEGILEAADRFNEFALQLFQASLVKECWEGMAG